MIDAPAKAKTIHFCKVCEKDTPHALCALESSVVRVCLICLERAKAYEQDRD